MPINLMEQPITGTSLRYQCRPVDKFSLGTYGKNYNARMIAKLEGYKSPQARSRERTLLLTGE